MAERQNPSFIGENDNTVRIGREVIDNAEDRMVSPLIQGESRTFLPPEEGRSERTTFHMAEGRLFDGREPASFQMRTDEEGKWVVEAPALQGEQWRLEPGEEYTIRRDGLYRRKLEDVQRGIPPRGPIPPGENDLVLHMMMKDMRDVNRGVPAITFLAHESASGQGDLLSVSNTGDQVTRLETISAVTPERQAEETMTVPAELIEKIDESGAPGDVPEMVERPPVSGTEEATEPEVLPETTQQVDMTPIIAEDQEPAIVHEEPVTTVNETGDSEATTAVVETTPTESTPVVVENETDAPEEKKEDPLAGIPEKYKFQVRLGDMTREEALAAAAAEQDEEEKVLREEKNRERFVLDKQLSLSDAVDKVVEYTQDRLTSGDKAIKELFLNHDTGLLETLKRVTEAGQSIEGVGVLAAIADLKVKFGDYSADIDDIVSQVKEYLEAEEELFASRSQAENPSEQEEEARKLRLAAVDTMDKLDGTLKTLGEVNNVALETLLLVDSDLTDNVPTGVKYDPATGVFNQGVENPDMPAIREAAGRAMKRVTDLSELMGADRRSAVEEATRLTEELAEIRNKLKAQANS